MVIELFRNREGSLAVIVTKGRRDYVGYRLTVEQIKGLRHAKHQAGTAYDMVKNGIGIEMDEDLYRYCKEMYKVIDKLNVIEEKDRRENRKVKA